MTSRRRLVLGAAAALLLVAAAWLWTLLDEKEGGARGPGGTLVALPAASEKPVLPAPGRPADVVPLQPGGAGAAFTGDGTALADADGEATPTQVAFTGRVVDTDGAPIDGATVIHYPARRTRNALGLPTSTRLDPIDWESFPSTSTDSSGRFVLSAREVPASPDDDRLDPRAKLYAPNLAPQLVVRHPDYAARAFLCEGYERGDFDAGDIVLRAGAIIVGRVVDEDGRPLGGAEFTMSVFDGPWNVQGYGPWHTVSSALGGVSRRDGRFALRELWADRMTFIARLHGYVPAEVQERLTAGEVRDIGDVVLKQGKVIRGHVVDPEGEPIEGADVFARASLFRYGPPGGDTVMMEFRMRVRGNDIEDVHVTTDANGAFTFSELHLDRYAIFAGADGRDPAVQRDVEPGDSRVLLVLPEQATVLVTVEDVRTGERVTGVSATARRMMDKQLTGMEPFLDVLAERRVLDAIDADEIDGGTDGLLLVLGAGSYRTDLIVSAPGYATNGFVLKGVPASERARRSVRLLSESSVSGRVVGARAEPLPGAKVTLEPPADVRVKQTDREALADDYGSYRFDNLRAGDWSLRAEAEGHLPSEPRTVIVAAETALAGEDVQLFPGATLRGLVIGADGAPAANWKVSARLLDGSPPKGEVTRIVSASGTKTFTSPPAVRADLDGRFTFDGIPPGRYELKADPGAEQVLFAPAGEVTEAGLVLRRRPVVTGRVTDADGPVQGAKIRLHDENPFGGFAYDEADTLTDALGEYRLELWSSGPAAFSAEHDGAQTLVAEVDLDWGMTRTVDLAFGGGRAGGRVLDAASGDPIEGAAVGMTLYRYDETGKLRQSKPSMIFGNVLTDAQGRFTLSRLQAGPYRIHARAKGYLPDTRLPVEVAATGGPDDFDIRLARGATISGRVSTADGSPLPGALRVRVGGEDGHGFHASADVGADGRYEAVGLPGGSYVLRVESGTINIMGGGGKPVLAEEPVTVGDAQTVVKDLVIEPSP